MLAMGKPMGGEAEMTSSSTSSTAGEKTIPFLRRLTDMLMENEGVISFQPGIRNSTTGETQSVGRIIVHDRLKVESDILPRYFNHASFASLRRQLNYFAFSRVGKGKQKGAIYCNERVIELNDILRLKRRTVGSSTASNGAAGNANTSASSTTVPASSTSRYGSSGSGSSSGPGSRSKQSHAKETTSTSIPSVSQVSPKVSVSSAVVSIPNSTFHQPQQQQHHRISSRNTSMSTPRTQNKSNHHPPSSTTTTHHPSKKRSSTRTPKSKKSKRILDCLVPVVHLPQKRTKVMKEYHHHSGRKGSGSGSTSAPPKLALDLTISNTTPSVGVGVGGVPVSSNSLSNLQFPTLNHHQGPPSSSDVPVPTTGFHSGSTSMCSLTSGVGAKTNSSEIPLSPPPEPAVGVTMGGTSMGLGVGVGTSSAVTNANDSGDILAGCNALLSLGS